MASHNKNQDSLYDITPQLNIFNNLWIDQLNNNQFFKIKYL